MNSKTVHSAGLLMARKGAAGLEFLLAHPGGPFYKNKDAGFWGIPKGHVEVDENVEETAIREFIEETSFIPTPPYFSLGHVIQKSGKIVHAWGFQGDCDPAQMKSNTCQVEWPPRSGQMITIPEIDKAQFFTMKEAKEMMNPDQAPFLDRLAEILK